MEELESEAFVTWAFVESEAEAMIRAKVEKSTVADVVTAVVTLTTIPTNPRK